MSLKALRNRLLQQRHFRGAIERLRELEGQLPAPHTRLAVPFLFRAHGLYRSIRPMQSQIEVGELYQAVLARRPKVVLEIGTCHGGTLYLWCHDVAPRPEEPRIEVWKFWEELKQRAPGAREWLDNTATGRRIGIGIVPVPA